MFSFWLNYQQSGQRRTPSAITLVNVLLHFFNGDFHFPRRSQGAELGTSRGMARAASCRSSPRDYFCCIPLQTESVSYIASRSETLSVFFVLAALVVFLYRKGARRIRSRESWRSWRCSRAAGLVQGAHRRSSRAVRSDRLLLEL